MNKETNGKVINLEDKSYTDQVFTNCIFRKSKNMIIIFTNCKFIDCEISLDFNEFIKCEFNGGSVQYRGGYVGLNDSAFDGVNWQFHDAAAHTISMLSSFYNADSSKDFLFDILKNFNNSIP